MKSDVAANLAGAEADVSAEQARTVIRTFLKFVARCSMCEDSGEIDWRLPTHVTAPNMDYNVPAGAHSMCPLCGGFDAETKPRGDPAWVSWWCAQKRFEQDCRAARQSQDRQISEDHSDCGYRVMLPLDLFVPKS